MKRTLLIMCVGFALAGCSGGGSSKADLSADQTHQANQMEDIAKKSGGDWNKLSDADKKAMIMIGGSEQGAKMLLLAKSGKLGRHGGPGPGGPGGPPKS